MSVKSRQTSSIIFNVNLSADYFLDWLIICSVNHQKTVKHGHRMYILSDQQSKTQKYLFNVIK